MQTNYSLPIYKNTKNWKGELSEELLDYYDVWIEFGEVYLPIKLQGTTVQQEVGKGFVIMEKELDLTDCYLEYEERRYDINTPSVFTDRRGNFHHMEFTFK